MNNTDQFGRAVDYLRLSVTDRCNERCLYCMPETYRDWMPAAQVLTDAEILEIVRTASELGFRKFRITGGEPLIRRALPGLIHEIRSIDGVERIAMTTNGVFLPKYGRELYSAGLRDLNVSLDAIDSDVYRSITRGEVEPVLAGIRLMRQLGCKVKINTVLMRGRNEDQIFRIMDFAAQEGVLVRFIELMPVSMSEMLDGSNFLPVAEVRRCIEKSDHLEPVDESFGSGPARYYHLSRRDLTVGFISAITDHFFCERCNKMRVTADGKLRPCLGNHLETDLLPALRPNVDSDKLKSIFMETLFLKPQEHIFRDNYVPQRAMTAIGG